MHTFRGLATVLVLLCMASGPARAAAPVTDAGSGDLAARLAKLERLLENRGLVDMLAQIEALQQEVARLRGEIEVQNHALGQLREGQKGQYADLDERLRRLETGLGSAPIEPNAPAGAPVDANPPLETLTPAVPGSEAAADGSGESSLTIELVEKQPAAAPATAPAEPVATVAVAAPPSPTPTATPAKPDPVRERDDYQQAFKLLKQALYEQAIKAFREFLAAYPSGEYADNAQYWLGEAYYVTRQYENALAEYQALAGRYPNSSKLPDALLKIGYSHEELGQEDDARREFADLRQRFPGTTAARLADDRLKALGAAHPAPTAN
ncbi:MAG: tol-pal system protein YbgF [Gammaproteobacteria bacterium]|nr:tol-pal system protein YbgF [Gammaproteobacteria bacterium]